MHKLIADATTQTEHKRFNVAIARLMELTSLLRKAIDAGAADADGLCSDARRCRGAGADAVDLRAVHGRGVLVAAGQPAVGGAQPAGPTSSRRCWSRRRSPASSRSRASCATSSRCAADIGEDELRELALSRDAVQRTLDGRAVRTVVVRAPNLVNVVPG